MSKDLELYFQYRCLKGLTQRGLAGKQEYEDRLKYEISIIKQMGFCGYFLVVSDLLTWAQKQDIPCGPGRGSAAGSLACFCLYITHLDPLKYGLIFERFLNPSRVSMPDIDMDFCELRREEVVHYVEDKYGKDKVAHIGTYGNMKAKAAVRAVAKTLGHPYYIGDKLAKLTLEPIAGKPQPLSVSYEKVPELNSIRNGKASIERDILEWAEKVENRIRSYGVHASGVVISREPISKKIPLATGRDGQATTQFEMNTVEKVGLIKFDFLGLRALTTIDRCVKTVSKRHDIDIDPLQIPVDDQNTFKMLQKGDVAGVFQMEGSQGLKDLVVRIQPGKLEDISVLVACYRPGPLASQGLQNYLKVRAGESEPFYLVTELEPILKETDGLLIYQEQLLEICKQLAGYTMGEADIMRKIVGKKLVDEMPEQHKKFVDGSVKNNINQFDAEKIWNDIEEFAKYSFNKAHSACYGFIGYQMAYLKTHYPLEFMCSCLISDSDEVDKVIKYISYCNDKGINILGPDINESRYHFSISSDNKSIRFGLSAIKNLGKPVQEIIDEREKNGPFQDMLDFANRVDLSRINRKKLESLALAGAFDSLGKHTRASLLATIDEILRYKEQNKRYLSKMETYHKKLALYNSREHALVLWSTLTKEERKGKKKPNKIKLPQKPDLPEKPFIPECVELPKQDLLAHEKELLGFFVTGHPLDNIEEKPIHLISDIKEGVQDETIHNQTNTRIIAIPSVIKVITTKKAKQKMAFVALEDKTGTIQAIIQPKVYSRSQEIIDIKTPAYYDVIVEITQAEDHKIVKLIVKRIARLPSVEKLRKQPVELTVDLESAQQVARCIKENQGNESKVKLVAQSEEGNSWQLGIFRCNGDRNYIEKKLKECT